MRGAVILAMRRGLAENMSAGQCQLGEIHRNSRGHADPADTCTTCSSGPTRPDRHPHWQRRSHSRPRADGRFRDTHTQLKYWDWNGSSVGRILSPQCPEEAPATPIRLNGSPKRLCCGIEPCLSAKKYGSSRVLRWCGSGVFYGICLDGKYEA